MVSGGWINRARKEKEKAVFSRYSRQWEKGWGGSLQASRAGSLSESHVKTQGKRERDWLSSLAPRQSSSTDWQLKNAMICYVCPRQCRENSKSMTMQSEWESNAKYFPRHLLQNAICFFRWIADVLLSLLLVAHSQVWLLLQKSSKLHTNIYDTYFISFTWVACMGSVCK